MKKSLYTFAIIPLFLSGQNEVTHDTIYVPFGKKMYLSDSCADVDQDGICSKFDNCYSVYNPLQENLDGDSRGDVCDNDIDNDGLINTMDCDAYNAGIAYYNGSSCNDNNSCTTNDIVTNCNCAGTPLPDFDSDGTCDLTDTDDDNDGITDPNDCNPLNASINCLIGGSCSDGQANTINDTWICDTGACSCVGQLDTDGDNIPDTVDNDDDGDGVVDGSDCAPLDATKYLNAPCDDGLANTVNDKINSNCDCVGDSDQDLDGIADSVDNCPTIANSNQLNYDNDGLGDACDSDDDGDGVADVNDCDPLDEMIVFGIGAACDDGNTNTYDDAIDSLCNCVGVVDEIANVLTTSKAAYLAANDLDHVSVLESELSAFIGVSDFAVIPTYSVPVNQPPCATPTYSGPVTAGMSGASSDHQFYNGDYLIGYKILVSSGSTSATGKIKFGADLNNLVDIADNVPMVTGWKYYVIKRPQTAAAGIGTTNTKMAAYIPSGVIVCNRQSSSTAYQTTGDVNNIGTALAGSYNGPQIIPFIKSTAKNWP